MKIFLIIILSIFFNISKGQNVQVTTGSTTSECIDDAESFVILFALPFGYIYEDFSHDTALRKKIWGVFDVVYLIYKSDGKLYSVQSISHCSADCSHTVSTRSLPSRFTATALYDSLIKHRFIMANESVLPYTYQSFDDSTKIDTMRATHPPYFTIGVYGRSDTAIKHFNPHYFEEKIFQNIPRNLNYEINQRSLTYKYFIMLKTYFIQNKGQFQFQKDVH